MHRQSNTLNSKPSEETGYMDSFAYDGWNMGQVATTKKVDKKTSKVLTHS